MTSCFLLTDPTHILHHLFISLLILLVRLSVLLRVVYVVVLFVNAHSPFLFLLMFKEIDQHRKLPFYLLVLMYQEWFETPFI